MNIKSAFILSASMLLAACTYNTSSGETMIQPPVVKRHWQVDGVVGSECTITAGNNAIEVLIKKTAGGVKQAVYSTRDIAPGAFFNLRTENDSYRTIKDYFPFDTSDKIIHELLTSKNVYLEWDETPVFSAGSHASGVFYNEIPLGDFGASYEKCKKMLGL